MLPKAVPIANTPAVTVTTSGPLGMQGNTSMAKLSKHTVKWYREVITQLIDN